MRKRDLFFAAALLLAATACSFTSKPAPKDAAAYFQEGETNFDKGLYDEAIASWEKARETYYSPELSILAEQKIAEAHFRAEHYIEAAAALEDFLKQHPGNEHTPEILYLLGMSYYKQMLSIDRDQTPTRNAFATFQNLLERYPEDSRRQEVKPLIEECRNLLAAHEVYIGRFYLRYGHPEAAIRRLQAFLPAYPDYPGRDEAYFLLGQAYLKTGHEKDAAAAFETLNREFPQSEFIAPARKILSKAS